MSSDEKADVPVLAAAVPPRPFQFRLIHLLVAMELVCVALERLARARLARSGVLRS